MIDVYGREFEPSGTGLFQHYSATQNFPEILACEKKECAQGGIERMSIGVSFTQRPEDISGMEECNMTVCVRGKMFLFLFFRQVRY